MIRQGDWVKLSEQIKLILSSNGSKEHIKEFGNCIGVVEDRIWPNGEGPEVNVRWKPSNLRYGYDPLDLIKVGLICRLIYFLSSFFSISVFLLT